MLSSKDSKGASLLALAVSSGNRNTVETVLDAITGCLTKDEVLYLRVHVYDWAYVSYIWLGIGIPSFPSLVQPSMRCITHDRRRPT